MTEGQLKKLMKAVCGVLNEASDGGSWDLTPSLYKMPSKVVFYEIDPTDPKTMLILDENHKVLAKMVAV